MGERDHRDLTSFRSTESGNADDVPAWVRREDARSRQDEAAADREGWSMVLKLVVPLVMLLLAGALSYLGLK